MSVVVVSWILVLLAMFGLGYSYEVRNESQLIQLEIDRHQLRAWARSGVELALAELDKPRRKEEASLGAEGTRLLFAEPRRCGEGRFVVGEAVRVGGAEIWLPGLVDHGGRLPVALADSISLAELPGMTPAGARIILKARVDSVGKVIPPFGLLAGFDELSRDCASRYLSRFGNSVNVNSASFEVLFAVGLPERAIRKMLNWRAGSDGVQGTSDDNYFLSLEAGDPGIAGCAFNSEEAAILAYLSGGGRLSVESRFFSLSSRGWGPGARGICEVQAILDTGGDGRARIIEMTEQWLN